MHIILNGDKFSIQKPITVYELLQKFSLENKRVAIEVNEEIIPKSEHQTYQIHAGDKVEIVHAIGGGS